MALVFISCGRSPEGKDLEMDGKRLISTKPPFTSVLPSEFLLAHSTTVEYPKESSRTRSYFFFKEKEKRVEEMLILQIADKTNPQAGPITVPSLKPDTERRMYSDGKMKRGELEIEYLIQSILWNPDAPSLQPIIKKGMVIPPHWAFQGQLMFSYLGEHAVFIRYSKDIRSFGLKVSPEGKALEKDFLSGEERKAYEAFQINFMDMANSLHLKNP